MREGAEKICKALMVLGGGLMGALGGFTPLNLALMVAMSIDYATGVLLALLGKSPKSGQGGLSSKAGFEGLGRKAMILLVVLLAAMLDHALGNEAAIFRTAVSCYYLANEGISILENAGMMGVPVFGGLRKALEALRDKEEL